MQLKDVGLSTTEILLPKTGFEQWAVVACDQYTSQLDYWQDVEHFVGDKPSALHIMLPEAYLELGDTSQRRDKINETMHRYVQQGVLDNKVNGMIYVERSVDSGVRRGLVVAIDLEHYDFHKGSTTLIRATEGTIEDRLPPRVKIRLKAPVEMPHIMVLIDDNKKRVIEPLGEKVTDQDKVYDFELMMGGGHIKGYKVNEDSYEVIAEALHDLIDKNDGLLYAMGDGNHSLATAKVSWETIKKDLSEEAQESHPARYALVEIVNLHDEALAFEPIHRVLFDVGDDGVQKMVDVMREDGIDCNAVFEMNDDLDGMVVPFANAEGEGAFVITNCQDRLPAAVIQQAINNLLDKDESVKVDYIHGDDVTRELGSEPSNLGILLPSFDKSLLFKTVITDGALPKKSFSMGHAHEKRFYLECRKIK